MIGATRRCPAVLARSQWLSNSNVIVKRSLSTTIPVLPRQRCLAKVINSSRLFHQARQLQSSAAVAQAARQSDDGVSDTSDIITQFRDLASMGLVSPVVIDTITNELKFDAMTDVQSATINEALRGTDMIAQARTGTGKTIGFLLPVLQNIIKANPELERLRRDRRAQASDIRAIIISPTRELAEQISVEASKLTRHTGLVVQTAVGGTQKRMMLDKMRREGCHLLVATPGRLNDLLSDEYSGVEAPDLTALVMDEADRLLDAGFAAELDSIMRFLPDPFEKPRQTLMFSATVPKDVVQLVRKTLKPDFQFIKTVSDDEVPTHERVPQKTINVPGLENYFPTLLELLRREALALQDKRPLKVLVYFNTTAEVQMASTIFREMGATSPVPARYLDAIHGKLSQGQRTRATDSFRRNRTGMLLSSDVTARGMDFPDVTHVIQVGLPPNQEQYIHRIGRTGRAGKEGQGYLIFCDLERHEARRRLRGLPIDIDKTLNTSTLDMSQPAQLPASVAQILNDLSKAMQYVPRSEKVNVYMAQLGIFQPISDKQAVIDAMNRLAKWGWGMDSPPSIARTLATRLGIVQCSGLVLGNDDDHRSEPRRPGGSFSSDQFARKYDRRTNDDPFARDSGSRETDASRGNSRPYGRQSGFGSDRSSRNVNSSKRDSAFGGNRRYDRRSSQDGMRSRY